MTPEHERHGVEVTFEAVAERAYEIYLARGGQEGLAEEDWDKAEAELRANNGQESSAERHDADGTKDS